MQLLELKRIKLIDGEENLAINFFRYTISTRSLSCRPQDLEPIAELDSEHSKGAAAQVSKQLGFKIADFDGTPIYLGAKKGLELFYQKIDDTDDFSIFSMGEFQPGRFICQLEALFTKDN
ncbi:hypothetical protein NBRC116494_25090 [Aurantivibrio plasticivorans]